jgi:hypothetical protein
VAADCGIDRSDNSLTEVVVDDYTEDVNAAQSFAYNYLPIIISLVLVLVWTVTDFDEYDPVAADCGIDRSDNSLTEVVVDEEDGSRRSLGLELREVTVVDDRTIKSWPDLVDLRTQASWIATQVQRLINSPRCTLVLATIGYLHGRQGVSGGSGTAQELREVTVVDDRTIKSWPDLVDLRTQASWIATQAESVTKETQNTTQWRRIAALIGVIIV